MTIKWLRGVTVVIAAVGLTLAAGYGVHSWRAQRTAPVPESKTSRAEVINEIPSANFPDLDGVTHGLREYYGKVLVLNFWAGWCPTCRKEIPQFMALQKEHAEQGLQFVGVALDLPEKVRTFLAPLGINYPTLIGGVDAIQVARGLGNRIGDLPYTVVFDRNGQVRLTYCGELPQALIQSEILPLL